MFLPILTLLDVHVSINKWPYQCLAQMKLKCAQVLKEKKMFVFFKVGLYNPILGQLR